jgi:two-component system sensor histidine kinase/response regulator
MGGDCGVTSTLGEGSAFWFTIRVHAKTGQATDQFLKPDPELAGVSALVVDDNATQRAVLSEYLSAWGMTVATAESGQDALDTLRAAAREDRPIAVALVDRFMPEMDGLEVKNTIADDPSLATRLVFMTALGESAGAEPGVAASLPKPIHRDELWTCIRIALGLQKDESAVEIATRTGPTYGEPVVGRLLLAEDNLINRKVAVAMLSNAGYRVDTVLDGAAAVQAAVSQPYDAILMDCQMPELNGYEATAAIRAEEGSRRHTPIIAMTAGARREDRERCLAAGMDSYLAKPVSKDALLSLVGRFVTVGLR